MKCLLAIFFLTGSFSVFADVCGKDDREGSFEPRVGRLVSQGNNMGCTVALIGESCVVTAGNCVSHDYVEFNVPQSVAGVPQAAAIEDRYQVDKTFMRYNVDGVGQQWAVIKLLANEVTGVHAGKNQGYFPIALKRAAKNTPIKVIGFGHMSSHAEADILNFAQQVSEGVVGKGVLFMTSIIEHTADTTSGSLGAPIINITTGEVLGVSTHGGCQGSYSTNSGTSITGNKNFAKAARECLAR